MTQDEADSIIDTINDRALEIRTLMITIGSIIALLMPAVEMLGILDITPYGQGDDEWITDNDWEWGDDFECGDGSRIEAALVDDGYKNCRDGSDEPDEPAPPPPIDNNSTVVEPPTNQTSNQTTNETIEEDCEPRMWDAFYDYNNTTDVMTVYWDADLTCEDAPHNLTVIWTVYYNATNDTGEWAGIQEEMTYETYYQDWDYVNLSFTIQPGRYDIFSTFKLGEDYTRGTDWFDVVLV